MIPIVYRNTFPLLSFFSSSRSIRVIKGRVDLMGPTREISLRVVFHMALWFVGLCRCDVAGLYLARIRRRVRERAAKYISLCNPPFFPSVLVRAEENLYSSDGIVAKFLRSQRNPFSLLSCQRLLRRTGSARGFSIPSRPVYPLCATGGFTFRGLGHVLQSPGSICLALSSTLLLADPSPASLCYQRACLTLSATRTAAEGFSSDINTRRYETVSGHLGVHVNVIGTDVAVNSPKWRYTHPV